MENSKKTFVYSAKTRRRRTVRIIKINRVIALIILIGIIATGAITYFAIKNNSTSKIDAKSFFFLQMGEFTSSGDALNKSMELKNQGASGYVINDGIFRVMATVFTSKSDADKVASRLTTAGKECNVFEVKTPKIALNKYDNDNENKLVRSLATFPIGRFFSELQAQDIALDSGETTDSAALLAASNLKKELNQNHQEIITLLSKHPADKTLNSLEKAYKQINQSFANYLPETELTIGTSIKSILCATIETYLETDF